MPRDVDHLVLAVRDLNAARDTYARLGFRLTPVGVHPFGTKNSLAQLDGSYFELLAIDNPAAIPEPTADRFSFADFNRRFLAYRAGLSMIALRSDDAAADRADFAAHGLPVYEPFRFERMARGPDGTERNVAFSVTFTSDARMREIGFFTCQHHFPENFWRPEYQLHPNGAMEIASVAMVARDPADFHEFFTYFTGKHDMRSDSLGVEFSLGRGGIDIRSPVGARGFFGVEVDDDPAPRLIGMRIAVADIEATRTLLTVNGIPFVEELGGLVVPPEAAHGAALAFVP